ncbi:Uncharacterised protein [Sebaldella termitidis]|uniref:Uncharacterized protein n=1 Tax=Sebaldella termitidis (strain ATCC 33386 / NCTC 11300) TaxID=526218 RepID=D1AN97_SEBTE|nr:hypothetical protein [Sebaldella termitidis]ACZ09701.1 hypothetical protein Sterm_2857 [Sebaldella termitidis ATCC 33386]SUI25032.1 Uncharacterised protein [Sebaldella termitidis]
MFKSEEDAKLAALHQEYTAEKDGLSIYLFKLRQPENLKEYKEQIKLFKDIKETLNKKGKYK